MTSKQKIPSLFSPTLCEQFACLCAASRQAEADRLYLPAEVLTQVGATIKRNLEVLGYGL